MLYIVKTAQTDFSAFSTWVKSNPALETLWKNNDFLSDEPPPVAGVVSASLAVDFNGVSLDMRAILVAEAAFRMLYADSGKNASFYNNVTTDWAVIKAEIDAAVTAVGGGITAEDIALKLIHQYDKTTCKWFLTVQLYKIGNKLSDSQYQLTDLKTFFDITDSGIQNTDQSTLDSNGHGNYSKAYFSNVCTLDDHGSPIAVQSDKHVQAAILAWAELEFLLSHNQIGRPDMDKFKIIFASTCVENDSSHASVIFPHTVVAYLSYDGNECLNNHDAVAGSFYNSAADYNTLCPPYDNIYIWPANLPGVV